MPQASSVLLNVKQRLPNDLKRQTVLPNSLSETISVGIVPSFFKLFPTDPTIQITAGDKGVIPIEVHFSEKQEVEFSVSGLPAGCKVEKNLKMNSSGTQQFSVAVDANAKPGKSSIQVDCSTNYHGHRIMTRSLPFEFEIVAAPEPAKNSPEQQDKSE